jgi:hypothetical protein
VIGEVVLKKLLALALTLPNPLVVAERDRFEGGQLKVVNEGRRQKRPDRQG